MTSKGRASRPGACIRDVVWAAQVGSGGLRACGNMFVCMCVHTCVCVCKSTCIKYVYAHVCVCVFVPVCVCAYM